MPQLRPLAILTFLTAFLLLLGAAACQAGSSESDSSDSGATAGQSGQSSSSSDSDTSDSDSTDSNDTAGSSSDSSGSDSDDSGSDGTVSIENPGQTGVPIDISANEALYKSTPLNLVRWTSEPVVGDGELTAAGELLNGAIPFEPMIEEGYAFDVVWETHDPYMPVMLLLPSMGMTQIWDTQHTVADMDWELEGATFEFRAYSPFFMDPSEGTELRVFGFDGDGNPALLSVTPIHVQYPSG